MSRKPKKGYYVRGVFVAEGSAMDIELKQEQKGGDQPSKTDLKRESTALQQLGEDLLALHADRMGALGLPDRLVEALAEARRITNFEGRRRQMQYVGKLMRLLDPAAVGAARVALDAQHSGSARETMALHEAERWRDRLIEDEAAAALWLSAHPQTDSQQLRALVRQARKDAKPDKAAESMGLAPRQGKAYREIFQLVRQRLLGDRVEESQA